MRAEHKRGAFGGVDEMRVGGQGGGATAQLPVEVATDAFRREVADHGGEDDQDRQGQPS